MGSMSKLTAALYNPDDDLSNPQTLTGAIMALSVGADKVAGGAGTLNTGMKTLAGASDQVQEAVAAFQSATGQLSDKSGELDSGMGQFKTDGVDKLAQTDAVDQVKQALAVKDAMEQQAAEWESYAGAPEGAEVSSAFIMKVTEEPEAEKPEETETAPDKEENFFVRIWNSIVDFFTGLFD